METITVYNSSKRGWFIALLGAVLVATALDLLVWKGLVAGLVERVYQGEEVLEARERVWAGFMLAAGCALIVWGVVSGIRIRPVLTVAPEGLGLALRGPFRPLHLLQWDSIEEVLSQPVADNGSLLSTLTIVLFPNGPERKLPVDPWGARWTGSRTLRVLASDWSARSEIVSAVSNNHLGREPEKAEATDVV